MFATGEMEEKPTLKNKTKIISQIEDSGWSVRLENLWPLCELASAAAPTSALKLIIFTRRQFCNKHEDGDYTDKEYPRNNNT